MSLRSLSSLNGLLIVPVFTFGVSVGGAALASGTTTNQPAVQTYANQAVPVESPLSQDRYNSPLAAGTLTLQDVLEAHRPSTPALPTATGTPSATATAPVLTPPVQSSATGLMMSQGMKAVLQKVGTVSVAPVNVRAPASAIAVPQPPAQASPIALVPAAADGFTYEPGQAPKNLGGTAPAALPSASSTPSLKAPAASPKLVAPSAAVDTAASDASCAQNVQKWEKSCGEAGYPSSYSGKISGETRTGCSDGAFHDVWVTNSCTPPNAAATQSTKTNTSSESGAKTNGLCGASSNEEFEELPSANLCEEGVPSSVNGEGPWTWACSGSNGGAAAACSARLYVPILNGVCGEANGEASSREPAIDLCSIGEASSVEGDGPWTWSCSGTGGGGSVSCIAPLQSSSQSTPSAAPPAAPAAAPTIAPVVDPVPVPAPVSAPVAEREPERVPASTVPRRAKHSSSVAASRSAHESVLVPPPAPVAAPAPAVSAPVAPTHAPTPAVPAPAVSAPIALSDRGELCGSAAETLAYEAPEKDLCRAGTASPVNGEGPWTWSCTNNEGVTSSCRTLSLKEQTSVALKAEPSVAPVKEEASAPVSVPTATPDAAPEQHLLSTPSKPAAEPELACGLAAGQSTPLAPASHLCEGGTASAVTGSNPWHWTCKKGKRKVSCETVKPVDGACGAANGTALKSAPFSGLCASGTPSSLQGEGPWSWVCGGAHGGVDISCAASLQSKPDKIDGACGISDGANLKESPLKDLCSTGTPSAVSGEGPWTWSCSGSNSGTVGSCSASKIVPPKPPGNPVNGLCGASNGAATTVLPASGLCSTGTLSGVVGNGPWNWSCIGENGGMTVSCTAPLEPPAPLDGICGGAHGVTTMAKPQSGLCSSGLAGSVNGKGPWTWTCSGANGGTPSSCIAPIAGKSGSMPSVMTPAADVDPYAAPAPSSGLVTPRLASSGDVPALDKRVLPSLIPSKSFASKPTPSAVPARADVTSDSAPSVVPGLSQGSAALQPPSLQGAYSSAPALQEDAPSRPSQVPGNHLVLDPTISTVLFAHGSGNIADNVLTTLDKLAVVLQSNQDARVSLIAYADNTGSTPRDARRLSLTRALAVRGYLASKGVSESRVDVHAEGANTSMGYIDRVDVKVND